MNKLDLDNPADRSIKEMIDMGLVTLYRNDDTNQTLMMLTEAGVNISENLSDDDDIDAEQVEKFLQDSQKYLDTLVGK
jgi:DNA-binding MarR family transcriptional regulator